IPHFFSDTLQSAIPMISAGTMNDIVNGTFDNRFAERIILDCRFKYEIDGGRIRGADHYPYENERLLSERLFGETRSRPTLIVLYCEFSLLRAPAIANYIRSADRATHVHDYPLLDYPDLYILDGGYHAFFSQFPLQCSPQAYVSMTESGHGSEGEERLGSLR
ncbi:Rhodanese-like protein, partial [Colletotrichum zoysiae]